MNSIRKQASRLRAFGNYLGEMQIPAFSAYTAFFLLLAVFPTTMLLMYLVRLTPVSQQELISLVDQLAPEALRPLLSLASGELYSNLSGTFIGITGVTLVWSASRCMVGLINGLNSVYHIEESRNYLVKRLIAFFYMIFFIVALMLLLLFHVFWSFVLTMLRQYIKLTFPLPIDFLRYVAVLCLLALFFMLVYKVFPNRKARFRSQLPGAVFASVGWVVFTWLFSMYVNNFSNYTYLYGSLTVVVLAMLWMYFSMMIFFVGGAINLYCENRSFTSTDTRP